MKTFIFIVAFLSLTSFAKDIAKSYAENSVVAQHTQKVNQAIDQM